MAGLRSLLGWDSRVVLAGALALLVLISDVAGVRAADLDGASCCADMDERIAELEAAAVRRGNRRVALTLSGHVNTSIYAFDASVPRDRDVYLVTNGFSQSRIRLRGVAAFAGGWQSGVFFEIGVPDPTLSPRVRPNGGDNVAEALVIRQSYGFVSNKRLGRLSVGQIRTPTDGIAHVDFSGVSVVRGLSSTASTGEANFGITSFFSADGVLLNVVRYDSPTVAGFTASASWGEDDYWDVALRYRGQARGWRIGAGIGFNSSNDEVAVGPSRRALGMSGSVWHRATGFFVSGSYSQGFGGLVDRHSYHVRSGVRRRFVALGDTVVFGEYGDSQVPGGETALWGGGVIQKIDAAATDLYLSYRHFEDEGGDTLQDLLIGARVRF